MKNKKNRKWKIFVIVIAILIVIRLILPYVILHYANKSMANMKGYYGHINDIDLSLYRGAYVLKGLFMNKVDSVTQNQTPFFSSPVIDLSVEWKSLFHGRIVGELEFNDPLLRFTKDKVEPETLEKDTATFKDALNHFMPLKINRFEVDNGKIQYIDSTTTPIVNIFMDRTHILAQNLSSVRDTALLPARVQANANVYHGIFDLQMKLDPLADSPTYDMNAELQNTNLPELNSFFKAYANFDVHKGNFGLYTELAAKDRKFKGYVKPVIKDFDVVGPEDRHDSFFNQLWEHIVGAAGVILRNQKKDQIATKVPIEGEFGKTTVGTWHAVFEVLRNAFIRAIYPALDYQITIASVDAVKPEKKKNFLQKIFSKPETKKHKKVK